MSSFSDKRSLYNQFYKLQQHKHAMLKQAHMFRYAPYEKQKMFHLAGTHSAQRMFLAGNRCGKTYCGVMEMAYHLTGEYPAWWHGKRLDAPIQAWAASVTMESVRDILQTHYLCAIPPSYVIHKTYKRGVAKAFDEIKVQHITGGVSTLGFKSYDQGREKFQGTARHIIHLDEEPPADIFAECLLRTMTTQGQIILTMTPLLGETALIQQFLHNEINDRTVIQASWDDAKHLSVEDKNRLRSSLRAGEREAREFGIPQLSDGGLVYPVAEDEIKIERCTLPAHCKHVFGLDFGWTNPTAAVWGAYDYVEDILYLYAVYYRNKLAPAEHAKNIQCVTAGIPGVCDPAGQATSQADGTNLIGHYESQGLSLIRADNTVETGLMQVLERMQNGKLKVFADLEPWWHEFRQYRRGSGGKIIKQHDHLMDATRYLVVSGLTIAKQLNVQSTPRKRLSRGEGWTV